MEIREREREGELKKITYSVSLFLWFGRQFSIGLPIPAYLVSRGTIFALGNLLMGICIVNNLVW